MVYSDNATTSYQKPERVVKAVNNSFKYYCANPGRSGHDLSVKTSEIVYKTRESLNEFFCGFGAENVAFTSNCTESLNKAIKGIIKKGDHIIISSLEHNSVLRPVHSLKEQGIADYTVFEVSKDNDKTLNAFKNSFKDNTKLCVVTAVSNVFGDILPLSDLSNIAHEKNALFFVDGAQGAGLIPISMKNQGIDCLCIPGHKGLLGPMGTGAILHNNLDFTPLIKGGTGTESFSFSQPETYPERLESGTLNVPGICGLYEGVREVKKRKTENIFKIESYIGEEIFNGLKNIKGVKLYEENYDKINRAPVISFNVQNAHSERVAFLLNSGGVAVRGGYHCAPLAHILRKTKQTGTVRISPSLFTSKKDINILLNLTEKIAFKYFI